MSESIEQTAKYIYQSKPPPEAIVSAIEAHTIPLAEEIARLKKKIVELEAEADSQAHSLIPETIHQLHAENQSLNQRVAELEDFQRNILST